MPQAAPFRKDLAKIFLSSLLSLFLIPSIAFLFVALAQPQRDRARIEAIVQGIDRNTQLSDAEKQNAKQFVLAHPPSTLLDDKSPEVAAYRALICAPFSEVWQFSVVGKVSLWTILAGLFVLLAVLILAGLAFLSRGAQYVSFVLGWRLLTWTSAAEAMFQGTLAVWLSFWLTAHFTERYSPKLVLLIGMCAALAIFYVVVCIFKRPPRDNMVEGELVAEADSPRLWTHIRELAARVGTAAPDNMVAGIDTNFFVTEAPLGVAGRQVTGRSLFVSIPLLRQLDATEAEAVLAHELAHLRGRDSASSAALGPKLVQYDHYCQMMRDAGVTILVFHLMRLYRVVFEFALQSDSREREFLADRTAAEAVSPVAIVRSLIKIAAYASYRAQIERKLFEENQQHEGALGIANYVTAGLAPYAASSEFLEALRSANVPHPFDSHPPLPERMKNVGHQVDECDFGQIVTATPSHSWADEILTAQDIEQRLWQNYEGQFAVAHEVSLAHRYEPANETEEALVLKFFPPEVFELKGGRSIQVTYAGLILPGQTEPISWDGVKDLKYEDGYFGDVLTIVRPHNSWGDGKTTKVKLPGIGNRRALLKLALGRYWQRHQIMRSTAIADAAQK
jgi:Zn-dependent protease with chaperone function